MMLVAILRVADFSRFAKLAGPIDTLRVNYWERRYTLGAAGYMALLGLWTFAVFAASDDTLSRILAFSATLAHSLGIATRNFSFVRGTNAQIIAALVTLSLTFLYAGGAYLSVILLVVGPLFLFIKLSANRLRVTFLDAILSARENTAIASRLDVALNNMSHGLCMLDRAGKIEVVNQKLLRLLKIPADTQTNGVDFAFAIERVVKSGVLSPSDGRQLMQLVEARDDRSPFKAVYNHSRVAEITVRRTETGGAVIVVQDVTERCAAEQIIDRMAHIDSVTDLPNRRCFESQLAGIIEALKDSNQAAAILFLDLDDFKQVNDSLGHAAGDMLLRIVADRLKSVLRSSDLVARWGGDEFAVLLSPLLSPEQMQTLADRIIREVAKPCMLADAEHVVGVSIGIANIPADGVLPATLLSKADIALYAAKSQGRCTWRVFEEEMEDSVKRRRLIEMDLRAAIASDAIEVFYQPIVSVRTRKIAGFEALARWHHPERGYISPAEFIPLVENLGLMSVVGAAILRKACAFGATLPPEISISVNLSPSQFWAGDIVDVVRDVLRETGLQSNRLDLEVTETVLIDDRSETRDTIRALRDLGVRMALDDFGTGYSSLAYLLSVPLDRIKIDRAFTVGLGIHAPASILIDSVASMSVRLGLDVVIEGVETEDQLRRIESFATIDFAQGFLFSRPLPASEVVALLEGFAPDRAA